MEVVILPVCLLAAGLLGYLLSLKKQMRRMTDELKRSRQMSYNKQLGVQLFDKDLNELAKEINRNLDFQVECENAADCGKGQFAAHGQGRNAWGEGARLSADM